MASNPVMGAISQNAADLSGQQQDLSVQAFTNIFGEGWWNLINASGNETLIYKLLETLNSCCAIVVAWLMIFTVLIASVGSAQEGRSIGGQYASAWVPLRFSFSFAAITPVFNGLCAMQILILACIGVSIDLANTMFRGAIGELTAGKNLTYLPPPKITGVGQQLAAGAVESQTIINYLITQSKCEGIDGLKLGAPTVSGQYAVRMFEVPEGGLMCNGHKLEVPPGALGGFKTPSTNPDLVAQKWAAIDQMLPQTQNLAAQLATLKPDFNATQEILNAGLKYSSIVYQGASAYLSARKSSDPQMQEAVNNFNQMVESKGWFMLGSYYWIIANAAQRSMDAITDTTSYIAPKIQYFDVALHKSWGENVRPTLAKLQMAAVANPTRIEKEFTINSVGTITESDSLSAMGKFFDGFADLTLANGSPLAASPGGGSPDSYAAQMGEFLSGQDAIISTVQLARKFVNIAAGGMLVMEGVKVAASGVAKGVSESWLLKIATGGTGIAQGAAGAAYTLVSDIWIFVMLGMGAIWVFATTVAYLIPAMPFLIWLAAIVGWLVLCLEAIVAAPIWLIGHAMPEGQGFAGQHGRTGYMLILSILIRPVLLVISMFLAMIIMSATGGLIGSLFSPFTYSMQTFGGWYNGLGPVGSIFLFIILTSAIAILTWKIFDLTTAMPDRIIRWVGQLFQSLGDDGARQVGQEAIGQGHKGAANLSGAVGKANGALGSRIMNNARFGKLFNPDKSPAPDRTGNLAPGEVRSRQ